MPEAFEACIKKGGRVRTKTLAGGKFMHICYVDGHSYPGEVKTKKSQMPKDREASKMRKAKMKQTLDAAEEAKLQVISELPKRK